MVSFELVGGVENVKALLGSMELFSLAESLGGVESLVAHPASMTHAAMDEAARERAGISATLVRLSIGIEDGDDLVRDLTAGLDADSRSARCAHEPGERTKKKAGIAAGLRWDPSCLIP